jgi:uncharacterized protein YfcZ (UPF0381/DUF406 family)
MLNISDVIQNEVHTVKLSVPYASRPELQISLAKFKSKIRQVVIYFPSEFIQAGSQILASAIHKLIYFIRNKEELSDQ